MVILFNARCQIETIPSIRHRHALISAALEWKTTTIGSVPMLEVFDL